MPDHPWFLGCQFHPEFKSKPLEPHPLFAAFIGAAHKHRMQPRQACIARAAQAVLARRLIRLPSLPPIGRGQPLALIAGPCVIESEEHVHFLAAEIRKIAGPFVFKASFDKANRSSVASYRGPGLEGRPAHSGGRAAAKVIRCSPIFTNRRRPNSRPRPRTFCRSRHFSAARPICWSPPAAPGRIVNIKKGQFVSPHDIRHAAEKVASTGNNKILLTERGSSFGYNNLVVDMRGLADHARVRLAGGFRRHAQRPDPGRLGHASGGQPQFIPALARAAVAAGVDGVFVEVHEAPERALSDGPNALRLDLLGPLLEKLRAIHALVD